MMRKIKELRKLMDTYRPEATITVDGSVALKDLDELCQADWLDDPNGLIFYKGKYHLFYQYNPRANVWEKPYWGHAVSEDLVHWEHLPITELEAIRTPVFEKENVLLKECEIFAMFYDHLSDSKNSEGTYNRLFSAYRKFKIKNSN